MNEQKQDGQQAGTGDKHVDAVIAKHGERVQRGLSKYGGTLPDNLATLAERLNHAQEEVLDLAVYLQWAMCSAWGHEQDRLAQGWKDFADAIGFPKDRQRFKHHVVEFASRLKAERDEAQQARDKAVEVSLANVGYARRAMLAAENLVGQRDEAVQRADCMERELQDIDEKRCPDCGAEMVFDEPDDHFGPETYDCPVCIARSERDRLQEQLRQAEQRVEKSEQTARYEYQEKRRARHQSDVMRQALLQIADSEDAGRYDGKPEPCPVHDAVTMHAIATQALDALPNPSERSGSETGSDETQAVLSRTGETQQQPEHGQSRRAYVKLTPGQRERHAEIIGDVDAERQQPEQEGKALPRYWKNTDGDGEVWWVDVDGTAYLTDNEDDPEDWRFFDDLKHTLKDFEEDPVFIEITEQKARRILGWEQEGESKAEVCLDTQEDAESSIQGAERNAETDKPTPPEGPFYDREGNEYRIVEDELRCKAGSAGGPAGHRAGRAAG